MSGLFISHSSGDSAAARELAERLSEWGYHSLFLDFDPEHGIRTGSDWEGELYRHLKLSRALIAVVSESSLQSRWCFAELTQARSLGKPVFPLKIERCETGSLLEDRQVADLTEGKEAGYERLKIGLDAALGGELPFDRERPYPGLVSFESSDVGVFFGREEEQAAILEALERLRRRGEPRLALVLGASGSGKSSIVKAGVLPRLGMSSRNWLVVPPFRPGEKPNLALARSLAAAFENAGGSRTWREVMEALEDDSSGVHPWIAQAEDLKEEAGMRGTSVLLVIDQFEELLGGGTEEGAARLATFRAHLRSLLEDPTGAVVVLATLRSDFLGQFQTVPELSGLEFESLAVGPMPIERLDRLIVEPAQRAGVEVEESLVRRLIDDTGSAEALPLLAYALRELWERRDGDVLTAELYEQQLGSIEGAIARIAEGIGEGYGPEENAALRTAFLRLVRVDDERRIVRRTASWDEIPNTAKPLVEEFIDEHLLVSDTVDGERHIEVAHEALFEHWKPLSEWIEINRENIIFIRQLNDAVRKWEEGNRADGDLWRAPSLDRLADFAERQGDDLDHAQRDFFLASQRARRRGAALRIGSVMAAAVALVAGFFGFYAWQQREAAVTQAQIAKEAQGRADASLTHAQIIQSRFLADLSRQQTSQGSTTIAMRLGLHALEDDRPLTLEAQGALYEALVDHREEGIFSVGSDCVSILGLASGGRFALLGDGESRLNKIVDLETNEIIETTPPGGQAAAHPELPLVAVAEPSGSIAFLSLPDMSRIATVDLGLTAVPRLGFSRDGTRLLITSGSAVHIVSTDAKLETARVEIQGPVLFPDAADARMRSVRSPFYMGEIHVMRQDGTKIVSGELGAERYLRAVSIDGDGSRLFWADLSGVPKLLGVDRENGALSSTVTERKTLGPDSGRPITINSQWKIDWRIEAAPDGKTALVTGPDGIANQYEAVTSSDENETVRLVGAPVSPDLDAVRASLEERKGSRFRVLGDAVRNLPTAIAFSPDGNLLAVGSHVSLITVRPRADTEGPPSVLKPGLDRFFVRDLVFTNDSTRLVSLGGDAILRSFRITPRWAPHVTAAGEGGIVATAVSPDGATAAAAGSDGIVRLFDIATGRLRKSLKEHSKPVYSLQFTDDGATLVSGSKDGRAIFWNLATGQPQKVIDNGQPQKGIDPEYWRTRVSADGTRIARIGKVGEVILLSRERDTREHIPAPLDPKGYEVYFDGNRPFTLAAGKAGPCRWFEVIDLTSEEVPIRAELPEDFEDSLDGVRMAAVGYKTIAVPTTGGAIALFDLLSGELTGTLKGHPGSRIEGLDFDAADSVLVSAASDGKVNLWDIQMKQRIATLLAPDTPARALAISGDAATIVLGSGRLGGDGNSTVAIWRRPTTLDALKSSARELLGRDLTEAERRHFFIGSLPDASAIAAETTRKP